MNMKMFEASLEDFSLHTSYTTCSACKDLKSDLFLIMKCYRVKPYYHALCCECSVNGCYYLSSNFTGRDTSVLAVPNVYCIRDVYNNLMKKMN